MDDAIVEVPVVEAPVVVQETEQPEPEVPAEPEGVTGYVSGDGNGGLGPKG